MDDLKEVVENSKGQSMDGAYVVFDLETTGLSAGQQPEQPFGNRRL